MANKVEFLATFPPITTALKITGGGNGMRIQLDIPEDEMGNAAHLLLMRQCVLRVTVEVVNDGKQQPTTTVSRTTAKKRNR